MCACVHVYMGVHCACMYCVYSQWATELCYPHEIRQSHHFLENFFIPGKHQICVVGGGRGREILAEFLCELDWMSQS